jgi:hypothetical protein
VKRRRRSERIWTSTSADASESVLPVADSARFCRRVRVQGNRPRASKLRVNGVRAVQGQGAGDATERGDPAGSYAGVPAVFQWHTCASRRSSTREQENLEVRGGVSIANQFGSIVSSHDPRHPTVFTLVDRSTAITTSYHGDYFFGHLPPTATLPGKLLRHPRNLVIVELFSSPILFAAGIHFSPVLLHNQGYPKVYPNPLNLPNAGDSFAGTSSLSSCSLFSPTRDLIALV